ncbi:MAG: helix-turn-helix domain-containing protein, partial [Rhodobacteraceae bacterium]|nr:helix-turn-helix domain-containing protein [Paracoccaceae bacterium]
MRDSALERAIVEAGGVAALARAINVTPQAVSQWDRIPAERVIAVETATNGKVTRHQLRPDLYPAEGGSPDPVPASTGGKWVYAFGAGKAEGRADMKNLLGGKGA